MCAEPRTDVANNGDEIAPEAEGKKKDLYMNLKI